MKSQTTIYVNCSCGCKCQQLSTERSALAAAVAALAEIDNGGVNVQYRDRRCISKDECISMTSVFGAVVGNSVMQKQVWKVRNDGVCDVSCPSGNYTESLTDHHLCVRCVGSCPKGMNLYAV